jgi:phage virion morphogenesis protein
MARITLTIDGLTGIKKATSRLEKGFDLEEIIEDAGALLLNRVKTRFLAQEAPDGEKWPVSDAARKREKSGRGGGTLYDTGRLWLSIQEYRTKGGAATRIGTDVPYAVYHQNGVGQLKREFLGFSDEDVELAAAIAKKKVEEQLSGAL